MKHFAVFGAGMMGAVHAHNLAEHPQAHVRYIYDVDTTRSSALAKRYGAETASLDAIFTSDIDAVLIASSTNTHAELVEAAVEHGKHIFCEKPIDLDIHRVRAVCKLVKESGLVNMVDFNRRFDASHAAVKRYVESNSVGAIEIVQLTARDPVPPPLEYIVVSGGQLRDQVIHFFDLTRWLSKSEAQEVYTMGAVLVDPAIEKAGDIDTSIISIRLKSGALAHIDCSRRCSYGYDERLEVFGSKGMVESARQREESHILYQKDRIHTAGMHESWYSRMKDTYYASLNSFIQSLLANTRENIDKNIADIPTFEDGYRAQEIAEAATKSLQTKLPVTITYSL